MKNKKITLKRKAVLIFLVAAFSVTMAVSEKTAEGISPEVKNSNTGSQTMGSRSSVPSEDIYRKYGLPDPFENTGNRENPAWNFKITSKKPGNTDQNPTPVYTYDVREVKEKTASYLKEKYGKEVTVTDFQEFYKEIPKDDGKVFRIYTSFILKVRDSEGQYEAALSWDMNRIGDTREWEETEKILKNTALKETEKAGLSEDADFIFYFMDLPEGFSPYKLFKGKEEELFGSLSDIKASFIEKYDGKEALPDLKNLFAGYSFSRELKLAGVKDKNPEKQYPFTDFLSSLSKDIDNVSYYSYFRYDKDEDVTEEIKGDLAEKEFGNYRIVMFPPLKDKSLKPELTVDRPDPIRMSLTGKKPIGDALKIKNTSDISSSPVVLIIPRTVIDSVLSPGEKAGFLTWSSYMGKDAESQLQELTAYGNNYVMMVYPGEETFIQPVLYKDKNQQ